MAAPPPQLTPIDISVIFAGKADISKIYKKKGVNVKLEKSKQSSLLYMCCFAGKLNYVTELVKAGADINIRCSDGETPLIACCLSMDSLPSDIPGIQKSMDLIKADPGFKEKRLKIAKLLIDRGADIHATTENGDQAIHFASANGFEDMIQYLVREKGVDVNTLNERISFTPLHWASMSNRPSTVRLLLELGANVNAIAPNSNGYSPLHTACLNKPNVEIVKILLASGADQTIRDTTANRRTPKGAAIALREESIVRLRDPSVTGYQGKLMEDYVEKSIFVLDLLDPEPPAPEPAAPEPAPVPAPPPAPDSRAEEVSPVEAPADEVLPSPPMESWYQGVSYVDDPLDTLSPDLIRLLPIPEDRSKGLYAEDEVSVSESSESRYSGVSYVDDPQQSPDVTRQMSIPHDPTKTAPVAPEYPQSSGRGGRITRKRKKHRITRKITKNKMSRKRNLKSKRKYSVRK
jgi:ankyrin repeat protein